MADNAVATKESAQALITMERDISDAVLGKIKTMTEGGDLKLPETYNAGTALKQAFLKIKETKDKNGKNALQVCTTDSISRALLGMCVQGLEPSKNQCYFIVYGNELNLFRSYFGAQAALRRAVPSVGKIVTDIAHEGDEYEFEVNQYGERYIKCIITDPMKNVDKPYAFGFCNIYDGMGNLLAATLMSWAEIEISWKQSKTYGNNDSPHKKFPEEMAKRTLINRACKNILNSSIESDPVIAAAINQTNDAEYERVEVGTPEAKTEKKSFKERYQIGKKVEPEPQPEPEPEQEQEQEPAQDPEPMPQPDYNGPGPEEFEDSGFEGMEGVKF